MSLRGDPTHLPDARAVAGGGALGAAKTALSALVRGARGHRLAPGTLDELRLSSAARAAWVSGCLEALEDVPVLVLGVARSAIHLGEIAILDGADADVAGTLHAAGAQAIVLSSGVTEDELMELARLLLTRWPAIGAAGPGEPDLETAHWGLDLPHVHIELAGGGPGPVHHESRTPGRFRAEVDDPTSAPPEGVQTGMLDPALLAELDALRADAAASVPEPAKPQPRGVPIELAAEAASVRSGGDLQPEAVAELLFSCIEADAGADQAGLLARWALGFALSLLGGPVSPGPVTHGLLLLLDPALSPDEAHRGAVRAAMDALATDPWRERLSRVVSDADEDEVRGDLFSVFSLVEGTDAVASLTEAIPHWATRILADAVLLREGDAGVDAIERARARLRSAGGGPVRLALAMAARLEDARLTDPVLAHADDPDPAIREAVLLALRKQRSSRVREVARRRLSDPVTAVRLEALRYCVAYRDPEAIPLVEARLSGPEVADLDETEVRALCLALGRLSAERAEALLADLATGRRRGSHPSLARFSLHGLKVAGTAKARAAIEEAAAGNARLQSEAQALLAGEDR
jgi:hypothetical protein